MNVTQLIKQSQDKDIYENIEAIKSELITDNKWLDKNENSEDEKLATRIMTTKNRVKRLKYEFDEESKKLRTLEKSAEEYLNVYRIATFAEADLIGITATLEAMSEVKHVKLRLRSLTAAKAELEKAYQDLTRKITQFERLDAISHFNIGG